jgi:hypothetical protein
MTKNNIQYIEFPLQPCYEDAPELGTAINSIQRVIPQGSVAGHSQQRRVLLFFPPQHMIQAGHAEMGLINKIRF